MKASQIWMWLRGSSGQIRYRVLRSGIWLLAGDGLSRSAAIIKVSILGRLLSPADFGLVGIGTSLLAGLEFFTQTGITHALLQKQGNIQPYLNTVFTIQAFRGLLLCLGTWLGAPYVAAFFKADATTIIRCIGLVLLLRGLNNPAVIYFRKDLDYRRDTLWRSGGVIGSLAIGVAAALLFRNAWALVASVISAQAIETVASYFAVSFRPRFHADRELARELFGFGKWIFWSNLFVSVTLYLDTIVIGRSLGVATLGLYQVGSQLAMAPTWMLGNHISGLSLPALSKLASLSEIGQAFLRLIRVMGVVVVPFVCMLTLFAELIVRVLLGPRWIGSVDIVRALGWGGFGMAVSGLAGATLVACAKPALAFRVSMLRAFVLGALIAPMMYAAAGLGVAVSVAAAANVGCLYSLRLVRHETGWAWNAFGRAVRPTLAACLPYFTAAILARAATAFTQPLLGLAILLHGILIVAVIRGELLGAPVTTVPRSSELPGEQAQTDPAAAAPASSRWR